MSKKCEWLIENLDFCLAITVACVSTILLATGEITAQETPKTSLILLITLTIFIAVKHYQMNNHMRDSSRSLGYIEGVHSNAVAAQVLYGHEELYKKVNSVIRKDSKVESTTFTDFVPPDALPGTECSKYWASIPKHLKNNTHFRIRRIAYVPSIAKLNWLKSTIDDCENAHNYHLAIISTKLDVPLLNLIIVDGRYSFIFGQQVSYSETKCTFIDNVLITGTIQEYFEKLWSSSIEIKIGKEINNEHMSLIEEEIKKC